MTYPAHQALNKLRAAALAMEAYERAQSQSMRRMWYANATSLFCQARQIQREATL